MWSLEHPVKLLAICKLTDCSYCLFSVFLPVYNVKLNIFPFAFLLSSFLYLGFNMYNQRVQEKIMKSLHRDIIFQMFCKADQPPQNLNFEEERASQSESVFVTKTSKQAKKAPTLKLSNPYKCIYLKTQK